MAIRKLQSPATLEKLPLVTEFVEESADRCGLDPKKKFGLLIALEEAFVNICSYAYPDEVGEVELSCGADGDTFVLEIADKGSPFDILSLPDPDTTAAIMAREIGGLGVHFIRKFADDVSYRRENGMNILRMAFKRSEDGST